jgi:multidrug efflux system membrane fusion protein
MIITEIASNKNYRTAVAILLLSALWLGSGLISPSGTEEKTDVVSKSPDIVVKTETILAQQFQPVISIKGRTEGKRKVALRAQVNGIVEYRADLEGAVVEKGTTLCRLATEDRDLAVQQADSAYEQAKIDYQGALALKTAGYQSKQAIATAKARLDAAATTVKRTQLNLEYLDIKAPFKGVVEMFQVEQGDLLGIGGQCAELIELDPLVVAGSTSESHISQLHVGMPATVEFNDKRVANGTIAYLASEASERTRTFLIEVNVDNKDYQIRAGLTAEIKLATAPVTAHKIPSAVLTLDDNGRVGVKHLTDNNDVLFSVVDILDDTPSGIWVAGLPVSARLITVGQEYVTTGQKVVAKSAQDTK